MSKLRLIANKPLFIHNAPELMRIGILPARKEQLLSIESTDVEYDKVSGAVYLKPLQLSKYYLTTYEKSMTRYSKAKGDFKFYDANMDESETIAAEWEDTHFEHKKNVFLTSTKNTGGYVVSKNTVGKKRGFFFRFSLPPSSDMKQIAMHFFFGGYYKLDVYTDGLTVLYSKQYSTEFLKVGQGYITGGTGKQQSDVEISGHAANLITLVVMPIKHNCLYIHSPSLGGGWTWTHQYSQKKTRTIPNYLYQEEYVKLTKGENSLDKIIAEATFGFKSEMPSVHIQMMPLAYPINGLLKISYVSLVALPSTTFNFVMGDNGSYETRNGYSFNEDGDYPAGTDIIFYEPVVESLGDTNSCVITCMYEFKADAMCKFTPMLYNHTVTFEGQSLEEMDDESVDITSWDADSMSLSLTDDSATRQLSWTTSDENVIRYLQGKMNIPITLQTATGFEIFYGLLNAPTIDPYTMTMKCVASDLWKNFDSARFGYEWVADGLRHTDAVGYLLKFAGMPSDRVLIGSDPTGQRETVYRLFSERGTEHPNYGDGFRLDVSTSDEPMVSFKSGSTVSEALKYLSDTFTGKEWTMGFYYNNQGKVVFVYAPMHYFDSLGVVDFVTHMYDVTESIGIEGMTNVPMKMPILGGLNYKYIEPEATSVRVIGSLDGSSNNKNPSNFIASEVILSDNEKRTLPVAQRSVDWVGERRYYGVERTDICTVEMCNYLALQLQKTLCKTRVLIEFPSYWNARIFPGCIINVEGVGQVRVKSMNINFSVDNTYVHEFPTTYMGELIR